MPFTARVGSRRAAAGAVAWTECLAGGSGSRQRSQRLLLQMSQHGFGAGVDLKFVENDFVNGPGFGGWSSSGWRRQRERKTLFLCGVFANQPRRAMRRSPRV